VPWGGPRCIAAKSVAHEHRWRSAEAACRGTNLGASTIGCAGLWIPSFCQSSMLDVVADTVEIPPGKVLSKVRNGGVIRKHVGPPPGDQEPA